MFEVSLKVMGTRLISPEFKEAPVPPLPLYVSNHSRPQHQHKPTIPQHNNFRHNRSITYFYRSPPRTIMAMAIVSIKILSSC